MILFLLQGVTLALSAVVTPGPFQAFLLSHAVRHGWRRTLPAALAPLVTDGPILALMLLVLTQMPGWFLGILRIAGGLFILFLARGVYLALRRGAAPAASLESGKSRSLLGAVAINALNPNPYIFWGVVGGPIVLSGWRESPWMGAGFLLGFFGTFVLGLGIQILLFASAGRLDPRVNRVLNAVAFAALAVFGLYQIAEGLSGLV
ncbi:MAG: LysE family transporter [Thermodesulfobacteriota bacterium]